MTTTLEIEGTEQQDPQLAEMRERAGELEADIRVVDDEFRAAREAVISRRGDQGAVDVALSRKSGIESALSELRTRISQREATLAAQRHATEAEEQKAEALAAADKAEELFYALMDARRGAVTALLACPEALAFVRARQAAHAATQDALARLLELTQGDRNDAVALLEQAGIDARVLQTPVYTPDRFVDRRGGDWSLLVEPLFKVFPPIEGGDVLAIVADFLEFGAIVPPDHFIQLGGP